MEGRSPSFVYLESWHQLFEKVELEVATSVAIYSIRATEATNPVV